MIVYGSSLSPFVRKVLVLCEEKQIAYDLRPAGPGAEQTDDFLEASPYRRIPAIRDGRYTLSDSSAIAQYLEAKHSSPSLIPSEPESRGRVVWFEEFVDSLLIASVGKVFFNRVVARLIGQPTDLELADAVVSGELPGHFAYLECVIKRAKTWLVDDSFGLADVSVGSAFVNLRHADVPIDDFPKLSAYIARVHARPSFVKLIAAETTLLAGRLQA